MASFLILRLEGLMQAWGKHTCETHRPSELFPTRSGLVGLLGACLGLDYRAKTELSALSEGLRFAVRADEHSDRPVRKIADFHTIARARGVRPGICKKQETSRREYLCDAKFTVALTFRPGSRYGPADLAAAVRRPVFTPFLGRRSCPLGRPLLDTSVGRDGVVEAPHLHAALAAVPPGRGTIYSEVQPSACCLSVRDVPLFREHRQFAVRPVFVHAVEAADESVPEQA